MYLFGTTFIHDWQYLGPLLCGSADCGTGNRDLDRDVIRDLPLLLKGTSTLAFRLFLALDQTFPALLAITQMIPSHSILHILTGVLALVVLFRGGERGPFWFAIGFGLFYVALAFVGMMIGRPTVLGFQPFDHFFTFY